MKRWKIVLICSLAAGFSLFAAHYRFGDSAHAIGMLNNKGGQARHPFMITSGQDRYFLIMTGVVLPPLQGDVRVALEGEPAMNYTIYNSEPVVDLGIHRRPGFDGEILTGVKSRDTLALWVEMEPQSYEYLFDGESEMSTLAKSSTVGPNGAGPLSLNFYASDNGNELLRIPVVFADLQVGGGSHGAHH